MFGRVSEKNILFPRSTNMFMIKGRISFMRLLVIPRGPGAEIGLRSLTIFVISDAQFDIGREKFNNYIPIANRLFNTFYGKREK